jgi:predicted secreted protein
MTIYILKERPSINVLNINDLFMIQVQENISTGYSWHYKIADPEVIQLVETIVLKQKTDHMVGRPN